MLAAACIVGAIDGGYRPALAQTQDVVIEMSVYGQTVYSDLTAQAESLASNAIHRQFSQDPDLATVQVVVMGDRNGEVIPILVTMVSRAQWQSNPQVGAWTRYYSASYALLQRHEQQENPVAVAPGRVPGSSNTISDFGRSLLIDEALDSGYLTGQAAQDYLSDLD